MRILIQRVSEASVEVGGELIGRTGPGLLLFVGIGHGDTEAVIETMVQKIVNLRIFADAEGKMNLSLLECGGSALAVSQFTLHADCRKGRRPSFVGAAPPDVARRLFDLFVEQLASTGVHVETGQFGAMMNVHLINDGPVTIWLDSEEVLRRA